MIYSGPWRTRGAGRDLIERELQMHPYLAASTDRLAETSRFWRDFDTHYRPCDTRYWGGSETSGGGRFLSPIYSQRLIYIAVSVSYI